jgi:hypothetical protein
MVLGPMKLRNSLLLGLVLFGAGALANCSGKSAAGDDEGCRRGSERCQCGSGQECDSGLVCLSEICVEDGGNSGGAGGEPGCGTGQASCDGACVNLQTDARHCGRCGIVCEDGTVCADGACSCPTGRSACGGVCVDLTSDPMNCGACAVVCEGEEVCSEATCADSCTDDLTQCGQSCVDLTSNADHCGLCSNRCGPEFVCDDGACGCPSSHTPCAGVCVDTDESPEHCGGCHVACPAGADCVDGECEGGGTGGSSGAGGGGNGGASGSSGSGGTSGAGGNGGTSGNGGSGGSGTGGVPTVMMLIDGSSSMFEPRESYWDPAYEALMDPTSGALTEYSDRIRFGLAVFQGSTTINTESNPACATVSASDIALDNRAAIDTVYQGVGDAYVTGTKYETPTGHAMNRVATALAAYEADPPGPKYIVLVTDGNPNTCQTLDPQCGQDLSIKAVQDARAQGIRTLVIGMGDVLMEDTGCLPTLMNCGTVHLKDLANAGLGLGVGPQPENYPFQSCVTNEGGLKATYTTGGDAVYYSGTTMAELRAEMVEIFERIVTQSVP